MNSIGKPVWSADYQVTRPTKTCDVELRTSLLFKIQNKPMTSLEWAMTSGQYKLKGRKEKPEPNGGYEGE